MSPIAVAAPRSARTTKVADVVDFHGFDCYPATLDDIQAAALRIRGHAKVTPVRGVAAAGWPRNGSCRHSPDHAHLLPPPPLKTKVMTCSSIDQLAGRALYFKCEIFQKAGEPVAGALGPAGLE